MTWVNQDSQQHTATGEGTFDTDVDLQEQALELLRAAVAYGQASPGDPRLLTPD